MAYKINDELAHGIAQLCLTEEWADVHFQVVVRLGEGEEEEEVETEVWLTLLLSLQVFNADLVKILDMVNNSNF
jgi:hypothetical protein